MSNQQPVIVFALFPDATQLDFTGPYQVFAALPGAEVILASVEGGMIEASGMTFAGPAPAGRHSGVRCGLRARRPRRHRPSHP